MNRVISDTAEYGCYLFDHACKPLLVDFMASLSKEDVGVDYPETAIDNASLIAVNEAIRSHSIETVGKRLRTAMTAMKTVHTKPENEPALA